MSISALISHFFWHPTRFITMQRPGESELEIRILFVYGMGTSVEGLQTHVYRKYKIIGKVRGSDKGLRDVLEQSLGDTSVASLHWPEL